MRIMHYVHSVLSVRFLRSVIKCIIRYPVIVFMGHLEFIYEYYSTTEIFQHTFDNWIYFIYYINQKCLVYWNYIKFKDT